MGTPRTARSDAGSPPQQRRGGSVVPMGNPAVGCGEGESESESAPRQPEGGSVVPMETPPHRRALGSLRPERDPPKSGEPPKAAPPDMEQVTLRALREAMETPPGSPTPPRTPRLLPPFAGNASPIPKRCLKLADLGSNLHFGNGQKDPPLSPPFFPTLLGFGEKTHRFGTKGCWPPPSQWRGLEGTLEVTLSPPHPPNVGRDPSQHTGLPTAPSNPGLAKGWR